MPNIKEFAPAQLGLNPTEIGVEATAAAARRGNAFFNEAAQSVQTTGERFGSAIREAGDAVVKYEDHREISAGAAHGATLIDGLNKSWDDTMKAPGLDPNDPSVAAKWREEQLEPTLAKFKEGFTTENSQRWAEHFTDSYREHAFHKTSADMSSLAGEAVAVNRRQTVNSLSNTVRGDPSSMDFALNTLETSTNAMIDSSPNLTGAAAAKVRTELQQKGREEIIKSAALGYIEKTGQVPDWTTDPKYSPYINGAELKQLAQAARYYERLGRSEERAARVDRDYQAKNDFNTKINDLEARTMPEKAGDPPRLPSTYWNEMRELSNHPGAALEPGRLKSMVTSGEAITNRLNKPEPLGRISHDTTMELLRNIRLAPDDPKRMQGNGEIYDAYDQGKLNNADFTFLNREFDAMRTPEGQRLGDDRKLFMSKFARIIDGGMNDTGIHSLLGTQRTYEFEMAARAQENDLRKKGLDPHLVYDPRSEQFFGRPENIAKFHVSLQDAQKYEQTLKSMDKAGNVPDPAKGPPRITSKAEYDKLSSDTPFIGEDGKRYRKP